MKFEVNSIKSVFIDMTSFLIIKKYMPRFDIEPLIF